MKGALIFILAIAAFYGLFDRHGQKIRGLTMTWETGTDLRTDNLYRLPDGVAPPVETVYDEFVSVTYCLDLVTDFTIPHCWFIADYVASIAEAAKEKRPVPIWIEGADVKGKTVEVSAGRILLNDLDTETGSKNFAKHWVKWAGAREMRKRANRGTVIHKAVEDYVLRDVRAILELNDYVGALIEEHGFAITVGYCLESVRSALMWLDKFLLEPVWCEAPLFNFSYGYAGTSDLGARLRYDDDSVSLWAIDFKGSASGPKPAHRKQAAAYGNAEYVLIQNTNLWVPMPKVQRYANVYATEEGAEVFEWFRGSDPYTLEESFSAFLHAVALRYYLDHETGSANCDKRRGLTIKRPTPEEVAEMKRRAKAARG